MGQLRVAPLKLPGSYGLNYQDELASDQAFRFASVASNGIIDGTGKLVARRDFNLLSSGAVAGNYKQLYVHRKNDGTEDFYSVNLGKVYTGTTTLTERASWSGTSTTLNSPQFASLNGKVYIFQAGISPIVLNEGTYAAESFTGAPWSNTPNCVIAAYGRLWAADDAAGSERFTLWFSNLLDGKVWNTGDAGELSLKNAWPAGQDSIVALAALSTRLFVFGRSSILMYTLPADNDPATMTLTDTISGIGCIARDSVVVTDKGIYFLSDNGVYRIDRLGQVTSLLTQGNVSKLVNQDVINTVASETLTEVRGGWYPKLGLYLLTCPVANKTYVFNTNQTIPQIEFPAVTTWTNTSMPFRAFAVDKNGDFYCSGVNGVFKYNTYTPDGANSAYNFEYQTQWLDGGDESRLKHFKNVILGLKAASGQTGTFRWREDYVAGTTRTATFTCDAIEFAEDPGLGQVKVHIGGSCNVGQFGFAMPINGDGVELHLMQIAAVTGKTSFR